MNKKESRIRITDLEAITNTCCCTNNSTKKLLNFARLHNVSEILENNLFEPPILLETIISDLEILESRIDLLENIVEAALEVAIEKN